MLPKNLLAIRYEMLKKRDGVEKTDVTKGFQSQQKYVVYLVDYISTMQKYIRELEQYIEDNYADA